MNTRFWNPITSIFFMLIIASLLVVACAPQENPAPVNSPTGVPTDTKVPITPTATTIPLPNITLKDGDFYFTVEGKQQPLFSRNIAAYTMDDFNTLLPMTSSGGSKLVRLQVSTIVAGGMGFTNEGKVDEAWVRKWEKVFDTAEANGVYVWVVFTGWYDWNTTGFNDWANNPFNAANGGPAKEPKELFESGSPTQESWLAWLKNVITRWQAHKNILIWEVYSEANLTHGVSEKDGVEFVEKAAAIIRDADPQHRLITNSLADIGEWQSFLQSDAVDFINIHPYPPSAQLDRTLIADINRMLVMYHKPVVIGESGLSAETPDSAAGMASVTEHADLGVKHAIWAAVVSGAANGRALYWEDGYGIYFPKLSWSYLNKYTNAELPAANFVRDMDFTGFQPLLAHFPAGAKVWGAAVGNEKAVVGWFRDAKCEPPDWPLEEVISGQTVTINLPGTAAEWKVDFYNTKTGTDIISSTTLTREGEEIEIPLPDFQDDIAFKMTALGGTISDVTPASTDPISGIWSGTISNAAGTFSTPVELDIQPACEAGNICGTFSAPQVSCSGELFFQEKVDGTFVMIEQNVTGAAACASGGYEYLQLQPDGKLSYKFSFTPGATDTSSGILQHP